MRLVLLLMIYVSMQIKNAQNFKRKEQKINNENQK